MYMHPKPILQQVIAMRRLYRLCACVTILSVITQGAHASGDSSSTPDENLTNIANSLGVTPESATVAGFDRQDIQAVFSFIQSNADTVSELLEAKRLLESLTRDRSVLLADARKFGLTSAGAAEIEQIDFSIERQQSAVELLRTELHDGLEVIVRQSVGADNAEMLWTYAENACRRVPAAIKCLQLASNEWAVLAAALDKTATNDEAQISDHISLVDLTAQENHLLTMATSSQVVVLADSRLAGNLAAVSNYFEDTQSAFE